MSDNDGKEDVRTELTGTEARQGRRGRPVLVVLVFALMLAGVAALFLHPYQRGTGATGPGLPAGQINESQSSN